MVKNKLDSIMARLDRMCVEEDEGDASCDENEHKRQVKLFERVVRTNQSYP